LYQIDNLIIYGGNGVCRVEEISTPDIPGIDKNRIYYALCPLYHDGKIFTPIDTKIFSRPVITYSKAQDIIDRIPYIEEDEYSNDNIRMMAEHYREYLQTHNCTDLVKLIKTIYTKNSIALEEGKKPSQTNDHFMKTAEDLLNGELAVALGIPKESVKSYIEERVKEHESKLN